jgi:hypothetical protein
MGLIRVLHWMECGTIDSMIGERGDDGSALGNFFVLNFLGTDFLY